jgi:hypothetical protein
LIVFGLQSDRIPYIPFFEITNMKILTILTLGLSMIGAQAASISVADNSFEINAGGDMNPGGWNNGIAPDWNGRDGGSAGGAFEEYIGGFVADGTDHIGMATGYYVWQDTGVAIAPNTTYTLTVAAGNRNANFSGVGNASTYAILAGGTNLGAASYADTAAVIGSNLTLASGSVDASTFDASSFGDGDALVFTTGATVPNENLVVLLGDNSPTGRSHFDNVRLDAVAAVPEVSSALLGSLAALFLLRRRR